VYANNDVPLWVENTGGADGSLSLVVAQTLVSSGAKAITNNATIKFFNIIVPPEYQGKACAINFTGSLSNTTLASGTYVNVNVGVLCEFVAPNGTTYISSATQTASSNTNAALSVSTSLVVVPKVGSTYVGVYVQNLSGVNIISTTMNVGSFSINVIDATPTYTQGLITTI
jgi:hypothetical protein